MLPSMRLEDKVVMVTGAGSGIGRAVAIAVAEAGAHCVPCELPEKTDDVEGVCAEIERLQRRALPVSLRLPDLDSIELAVDTAVTEMGRPEDVVGAVVFLTSPAADLITGHTLLVDGGWTAV